MPITLTKRQAAALRDLLGQSARVQPARVEALRGKGMNHTEAAYARHLDARKAAGEVVWWGFEVLAVRLADRTWYHPDFAVILADGTLELHEVKGFWRDDARIKIKVAAETFPARFCAVKKSLGGGGWQIEEF